MLKLKKKIRRQKVKLLLFDKCRKYLELPCCIDRWKQYLDTSFQPKDRKRKTISYVPYIEQNAKCQQKNSVFFILLQGSVCIKSLNSRKWNCKICILYGKLLLPQFQYLHFSRCHVLPTIKYRIWQNEVQKWKSHMLNVSI